MKRCIMLFGLALMVLGIPSYSQQMNPEVPGDHFSLEGALELFKKSESPEHFETLLNSPESKVNNLDLNGDGYIDYIRVFDRSEGNVHAFIIQAVVSEHEAQDIAVIELEKLANGKAVLQIIGDEDIYGVETIIEPTTEVLTHAGTMSSTSTVNVWTWPSVQYVYAPYYSDWYSPWSWDYYPVWYHTWTPIAYVDYYPVYVSYRPYYSYCHTRRVVYAYNIYRPYRSKSTIVYHRHHDQIVHYRSSNRHQERYASRNDRSGSQVGNQRGDSRSVNDLHRTNANIERSSPTREVTSSSSQTRNLKRSDFQKEAHQKNEQLTTDRKVENRATDIRSEPSRPVDRSQTMERTLKRETEQPRKEREVTVTRENSSSSKEVQRSVEVSRSRETQRPAVERTEPQRRSESPQVQQRSIPQERSTHEAHRSAETRPVDRAPSQERSSAPEPSRVRESAPTQQHHQSGSTPGKRSR